MAVANVIVTIDFFGLNTALPTIGRELNGTTATLQWIANIYLLFMAAPLIAAGRLGDLFGRRKLCVIGLGFLALGSLVAASAPNATILIAARAASGVAASLVAATSLAIVDSAFVPERRGYALGIYGAIGGVGSAIGPLVGGVITQWLSWRWFFLFQIPIIVISVVLTYTWCQETREDGASRHIDWIGTGLLTMGLFALVFGLVRGPEVGWSNAAVVTGLVSGVVLLVAFFIAERMVPVPLIHLQMWRRARFSVPNAVAFVGNMAFGVTMFQLTLYLQQVRNLSPSATGVVFLAFTIPLAACAPLVGRAIGRIRVSVLMGGGAALLAVSFACFGAISLESGIVLSLVGLFLAGCGQAGVFDVSNFAALDAVPDSAMGEASGTVNGVRQIGTLVGLAMVGAVFNGVQQANLRAGVAPNLAFVDALRPAMLVIGAVCAITAVLTPVALWRVERVPSRGSASTSVSPQ